MSRRVATEEPVDRRATDDLGAGAAEGHVGHAISDMTQASRFAPKPAVTTDAGDIAEPLLAWLREQTTGAAEYAEPPERISGGFDTQIWGFRLRGAAPPWDAPLIARVFRDGGVRQARFDAAVMRAVSDQGYPSPLVLAARLDTAPLGNAFIVMPRAPGVPMLSKLLGPGVLSMPLLLGQLHARLHTLDAVRFSDDLAAAGASPDGVLAQPTLEMGAAGIERAQLDGLRPGSTGCESTGFRTAKQPCAMATSTRSTCSSTASARRCSTGRMLASPSPRGTSAPPSR